MYEGVHTKAWYQFGGLKGFEPGYLVLTPERRVTFVGLDGPRFEVALAEVSGVKFPRHWFDGGCKLTVAGQEHRVDFVRPNGATDVTYHLWDASVGPGVLGALGDAAFVASKLSDIGSGRAAGKRWKEILTEPARAQNGGGPEDAAPAAAPGQAQPAQSATPAGWYADPQGEAHLRWWDGTQWTAHVAR